ncbi:MAG: shikimate kinase [Proteobacteria bacterium]|nr:shikimate kinase [Pseudomonadota bacterium]
MEKIYLTGFMGSGKTSTGKVLSKNLDYDFLDMDEILENREGISIKDIFAKNGEEYFRIKERELLLELSQRDKTVISTGGGVPCFFDNMDIMKKTGFVVYLRLTGKELLNRLKIFDEKDKRPVIIGKDETKILSLLNEREKFYLQAHFIIDCDQKEIKNISNEIIEEYLKWKKN